MTEQPESAAVFFDGAVSKRRVVSLAFGEALEISEDGARLASWRYDEIRRVSAEDGVLRLHATDAPPLARLELRDPEAQARIAQLCGNLGQPIARDVSTKAVVFWSLAAVASILALVFFAVPLAAGAIAQLTPVALEMKLGVAADNQIRLVFRGDDCTAPAGVAALNKMSQALQKAADLRIPANMVALSSKTPNAFALPGGKVYILSGLLAKAKNQDEVAGVLAHELGHLQHRDHLRKLIENGGGAYLIGLLFGDVSGGGAMLFVGKQLYFAAHSRETEAEADAFAAQTMARLGRPARPMGELLERVTGPEEDGAFTILHDHPLSKDRLASLAASDKGATGPALLSDEEWLALKAVCGDKEKAPKRRP